jgi:hypothetical protein
VFHEPFITNGVLPFLMKNNREETLLIEIKDVVSWNEQSYNVLWKRGDSQTVKSSDVRQIEIERTDEEYEVESHPLFWLEFLESTNSYLQFSITEKNSSLLTQFIIPVYVVCYQSYIGFQPPVLDFGIVSKENGVAHKIDLFIQIEG